MDLYRKLVVDLYKNPLNKRVIKNALTASGANATCGDKVQIYLKLDKKNRVADASFKGEGCAISIAAASLLTEHAKGKSLKEISSWNNKNIFEWLGTELGPARIKCGILALETIQKRIRACAHKP